MALRSALSLLLVLALCAPTRGAETDLSGKEGHPRARFPLAVHAQSLGDPRLDAALKRAVDDWNAVSRETLRVAVFAWVERSEVAQVALELARADASRAMGKTHVSTDDSGVIALPVRIVVFEPSARGQTPFEVLLYQVVAHELGHALGLPHTRDPRSLMCCIPGSVDFSDPVAREVYLEARRHPDVRSVRTQLAEHYERFWRTRGDR